MICRRPAGVALALLLTIACVLLGGMPTAGAAAANPTTHARLEVDGIDPVVASPGDTVTVSGTIYNPTDHDITPTVTVGLSPMLLDTLRRLDDWTSGRSPDSGSQVGSQTLATVFPGESADFSVRIPRKALHYTYQLASLPMTVSAGGDGMTTQRVRTTLQWSTTPAPQPIDLTIVVPLTLPADPALFGPSGPKRNAAWSRAIGPGSRIDELLTAMDGLPVTWLVDPELLDPSAAADTNLPATAPKSAVSPSPTGQGSTPPGTDTPSGTDTPGDASTPGPSPGGTDTFDLPTGSDEAPLPSPSTSGEQSGEDVVASYTERLLQRLRRTADTNSVWWLPYDDPDLGALSSTSAGRTMLTRELKRGLPHQLTDLGTTTVAWPVGAPRGKTSHRIASTWRKATDHKPFMLLPRRAVSSAASSPDATRRAKGTSGVLSYDETLSALLQRGGPVLGAQQVLARTLAIYQQQPGAQRSLSVVLPRTGEEPARQVAAGVRRILSASWLQGTSGREARAGLPGHSDATVLAKPKKKDGDVPTAPSSPLRVPALRQVEADRRILRGLGSIVVDADAVISSRTRGLDVVGSARWRGRGAALHTVTKTNRSAVESLRTKVSVRPSTVNFFTSSGKLTITVVNHLDRPLKDVDLALVPRKYLLRIKKPVQSIELGASARTTVRFDVKAVGAGQVQVDAVLRTPTGLELGTTPGDTTQLEVNVRPTSSWIYWALGIVAGLVLVVGLIRSVRRGPRELTTPGPDDEPVPTDPTGPDDPPEAGEDD